MKKTEIVSHPNILGGKPVINGTRISVELILDNISSGMSEKEILGAYPHITKSQLQAAVAYAKGVVQKNKGKRQNSPVVLYTHEISR